MSAMNKMKKKKGMEEPIKKGDGITMDKKM